MKTVSTGGSFSKSEKINLTISSGLSQFGLVDFKFFRDYKPGDGAGNTLHIPGKEGLTRFQHVCISTHSGTIMISKPLLL